MKKKSFNLNSNIAFGIIFFLVFLIIGLIPLKSGENIRIWSTALSSIFLIITIIRPNILTIFNKLWTKFGLLLGKVISPIIISLIFFFIITPIGLYFKVFRKDILNLKIIKKNSSYWINRKNKIESMKKQF